MMKRRRFRQTTTLAQRLTEEANRLRERARGLSPGPEQAMLWRKARQAETALRIDAWLASSASAPPDSIAILMEKQRKERVAARQPRDHDGRSTTAESIE
ncbi:MAG: hypothetical protein JOY90_34360 [Bradyrhizobium sp.]|uniref:hypothetical protein n=1 Tax=Bradyrhizobium sp. TaxID=376 RepID=UPI001DD3AC18|nr:hypothetical protein [Bradyrhizobium sp.]MBV9565498.1 hypothetical protein [Bradyrhizobium sp.]